MWKKVETLCDARRAKEVQSGKTLQQIIQELRFGGYDMQGEGWVVILTNTFLENLLNAL